MKNHLFDVKHSTMHPISSIICQLPHVLHRVQHALHTRTHTHALTHTYMHTHKRACMQTLRHSYVCTCVVNMHACIQLRLHTFARMRVCMRASASAWPHACAHTDACVRSRVGTRSTRAGLAARWLSVALCGALGLRSAEVNLGKPRPIQAVRIRDGESQVDKSGELHLCQECTCHVTSHRITPHHITSHHTTPHIKPYHIAS